MHDLIDAPGSPAGCLESEETRPGDLRVTMHQPRGDCISHASETVPEARQRWPGVPALDKSEICSGKRTRLARMSKLCATSQLPWVALKSERFPDQAVRPVLPGALRKGVAASQGSLLSRTCHVPKCHPLTAPRPWQHPKQMPQRHSLSPRAPRCSSGLHARPGRGAGALGGPPGHMQAQVRLHGPRSPEDSEPSD